MIKQIAYDINYPMENYVEGFTVDTFEDVEYVRDVYFTDDPRMALEVEDQDMDLLINVEMYTLDFKEVRYAGDE